MAKAQSKGKKWLMRILKVIGVFVILYVVIALFAPSDYRVERSREMTASPEAIFEQVYKFENWENWSPWKQKDPSCTYAYEGESGTVGSIATWEGDPDLSGTGKMVLTELIQNEQLRYDLTFEGMGMTSHGGFDLEVIEEGVKVTWFDSGTIPFMFRPMMLFMDIDSKIGPDFEAGLVGIDSLSTIYQAEMNMNFDVTEVDFPGGNYYGVRKMISMDEVDSNFYADAYGKIGAFCGENMLEMAGMPVSINLSWDMEKLEGELMPAFPVLMPLSEYNGEDISFYNIPACKALVVDYYGPYDGVGDVYYFFEKYLAENEITAFLSMEEYANDPHTVESEDEILTKVYMFLE